MKKIRETKLHAIDIFRRDHLRSTSGIICGSGSFAIHFGDHLRSGIICNAVQDRLDRFSRNAQATI